MAECMESSSSSTGSGKKPVVVRVKRKVSQERLDAFWLEINERPSKRPLLDLNKLSLSNTVEKAMDVKIEKLLVHHVETVRSSDAMHDILQSFMHPDIPNSREFQRKIQERRSMFKQESRQEQIRTTARQKHMDMMKNARFEQIWNRRKGQKEGIQDDTLNEIFHLYDIVHIDVDEEASEKLELVDGTFDHNSILCNYLPLIREYLPAAASEIESDLSSSKQEDYVYDLYTVEDGVCLDENTSTLYPLVQVADQDDYYDGTIESDYESDDSNAEDNPLNEYPDEESSENENGSRSSCEETDDDEHESKVSLDRYEYRYREDMVDENDEYPYREDMIEGDLLYGEEIVEADDDDNWKWGHR